MADKKNSKDKMLTYKGKPLVRNGNIIYYGDMKDAYIAMLQIQENQEFQDLSMAQKVSVQIMSTNAELSPKERMKKRTEKGSLYEAMHIASIWLERMLQSEG